MVGRHTSHLTLLFQRASLDQFLLTYISHFMLFQLQLGFISKLCKSLVTWCK